MNCIICGRFTVNEEVCIFCFVKYSDLTCKHIYNPNYCIYCGKQNPETKESVLGAYAILFLVYCYIYAKAEKEESNDK